MMTSQYGGSISISRARRPSFSAAIKVLPEPPNRSNTFWPALDEFGTEGRGSQENFRARRRAFRTLHEAGCFVIPNPWDIGSARYLQQLGFPALATTSAGFAFSQGPPDSEVALTGER